MTIEVSRIARDPLMLNDSLSVSGAVIHNEPPSSEFSFALPALLAIQERRQGSAVRMRVPGGQGLPTGDMRIWPSHRSALDHPGPGQWRLDQQGRLPVLITSDGWSNQHDLGGNRRAYITVRRLMQGNRPGEYIPGAELNPPRLLEVKGLLRLAATAYERALQAELRTEANNLGRESVLRRVGRALIPRQLRRVLDRSSML